MVGRALDPKEPQNRRFLRLPSLLRLLSEKVKFLERKTLAGIAQGSQKHLMSGNPTYQATTPAHFARNTIVPATIVHNTFASRISSGEIVKTSRSSRTKSARLPGAIVPIESRFMARAEFRV